MLAVLSHPGLSRQFSLETYVNELQEFSSTRGKGPKVYKHGQFALFQLLGQQTQPSFKIPRQNRTIS